MFTHGDLQVAHVFVGGDEITGVVDWSEAGQGDALYDLASLTLGHEEHLDDVVAGYGTDVDLDVIRAWWSLRSLRAVRWLAEHGFDPSSPGCEVAARESTHRTSTSDRSRSCTSTQRSRPDLRRRPVRRGLRAGHRINAEATRGSAGAGEGVPHRRARVPTAEARAGAKGRTERMPGRTLMRDGAWIIPATMPDSAMP